MALKGDSSSLDEALAKADHANGKMKRKGYEKELQQLQVELCRLQEWIKETGARIIILFEGRDAAGKGGTIKALTERVSPRVFRVVALPAPSDRQKTEISCSVTSGTSRQRAKSSFLTVAGITGPASNMSWVFAPKRSISASSIIVRRSKNTSWTLGFG